MKIDIEHDLKKSNKKSSHSDEILDFLMPWKKLNSLKEQEFSKEWQRLKKQVEESENRLVSRRQNPNKNYWNLGLQKSYAEWKKSGTGLNEHSSKAGQFSLNFKGEEIIQDIMPAGVYTHLSKHQAKWNTFFSTV
jgi:DNA gyrase/topoisomerase IV subunit A